ncbi:MAG: pantetheine-phosphate adenylyltransferase [Gemmatimonadales bacterium]|nr:pantetheine-phosphate adenylyltransferase [Gemmatimonadales bacterium]
MSRIGLYAGSFDPPTLGHEDVIRRAALLLDQLVVAIAVNPNKQPLLPVEQRLDLFRRIVALPNVTFEAFEGLLADRARVLGATVLVRGLRNANDLDHEAPMAVMNRHLMPGLETIFLTPSPEVSFVSGTLVREVARFGGDVTPMVHPVVAEALAARMRR